MPIFNFKKQFAHNVYLRIKRQTIRPLRKYPGKIGDMAYLYTGLRTKQTEFLGTEIIKSLLPIDIYENSVRVMGDGLCLADIDKLAKDDGFENRYQFFNFFKRQYGLPFHGILYKW